MDLIKQFFRTHQQVFILVTGYILVSTLAFGLGRFTAPRFSAPPHVQQVTSTPNNYSPNEPAVQSASIKTGDLNCAGKIKGSSSLIYHIPGGAFYNKTTRPIRCFSTEAEAKSAGFRKSSR